VTEWEIKIVQLMQKSNPPVNLLPLLVYMLYICKNLIQVVTCEAARCPDEIKESDLKKIFKSMSHFGNTHNYYYKTECRQFSCKETGKSHHVVGAPHLPTNFILNYRPVLIF
jgi:hypothetical protein